MGRIKLNGVSDGTLAVLEKPYEQSDEVKALGQEAANAYSALKVAGNANDIAAQRALNRWKNYGDFEYNPESDVLFQNAKANAIASGKVAMQDTVGQASALTGGYANSYATSAGSQAYQNYLKTLDDDLANYYQIALEQYERGKGDLLTEYSLENERGQQAWNKAYNLYGAADGRYNTERGFDYGKYTDDRSYAQNIAGMENADWWNQSKMDYQKERDRVADEQWQSTYDYQKERDRVADEQWQSTYDLNKYAATAKATSGSGKGSPYKIDDFLVSWSDELDAAGKDLTLQASVKTKIADQASTLLMHGAIDENTLLSIAENYLGIKDLDSEDSYRMLKVYFGPEIAYELKKDQEE